MPALDETFDASGGLVDSRAVSDGARRGVEKTVIAGVLTVLSGGLAEETELNESCVLTIIDSVGGAERSSGES